MNNNGSKLTRYMLQEADGSLGGNPANDGITNPTEQARLDEKVQELVMTIRSRIEK